MPAVGKALEAAFDSAITTTHWPAEFAAVASPYYAALEAPEHAAIESAVESHGTALEAADSPALGTALEAADAAAKYATLEDAVRATNITTIGSAGPYPHEPALGPAHFAAYCSSDLYTYSEPDPGAAETWRRTHSAPNRPADDALPDVAALGDADRIARVAMGLICAQRGGLPCHLKRGRN